MGICLVTGGAGFIGSHIVEELLRLGYKVRVIDNFCTGKMRNIKHLINDIELIKGDIRDKEQLLLALDNVEYVFHEAALRSVPRSVDDPLSTNDVNVHGTLLLLEMARKKKVRRVIYASSSSVYGDVPLLPKREEQKPAPISPYAVSKLTGEYYCRVYTEIYGLDTISLRYFNVFGPRQDPYSQYAAVVPRFILLALKNEPLEIHGDGRQSRDFTYVKNVAKANIKAMEVKSGGGKVYNIACGEKHSVLDIAETIGKILNKKVRYKFTPPRRGDVRHTLADISLARRELRYEPEVGFYDGMVETVKYFCKFFK
jgi:UDP-glucose 4-epimerase